MLLRVQVLCKEDKLILGLNTAFMMDYRVTFSVVFRCLYPGLVIELWSS